MLSNLQTPVNSEWVGGSPNHFASTAGGIHATEQQHNLNAPPDHMTLGGKLGSVERQIVDPHVEVRQRHGDHQEEQQDLGGPVFWFEER